MIDLTDKWKKGELESGYYFFKTKDNIKIGFLYEGLKYPYDRRHNTIDDVEEVLAPVPTYQEYLESEAHCAVYSEVNKQLRQLLKECKDIIEWYKADTGYVDLPTENLLTRINAAIGESEE